MRFDIHTTCPICGGAISWINGKTNSGIVVIKTRRNSTNLYHESCIDKERKVNKGANNG